MKYKTQSKKWKTKLKKLSNSFASYNLNFLYNTHHYLKKIVIQSFKKYFTRINYTTKKENQKFGAWLEKKFS